MASSMTKMVLDRNIKKEQEVSVITDNHDSLNDDSIQVIENSQENNMKKQLLDVIDKNTELEINEKTENKNNKVVSNKKDQKNKSSAKKKLKENKEMQK